MSLPRKAIEGLSTCGAGAPRDTPPRRQDLVEMKTIDDYIDVPAAGLLPSKLGGVKKQASLLGKVGIPPPLQVTPTYRHTYRFLAATGTSARNVTAKTLLGVAGAVVSVANTTANYIATSAKLHRVTIYPGLSSTGAVSPSVTWGSTISFQKDSEINRSMPQGVTVGGAVSFRPPPEMGARFWFSSSSNVVMLVTCPSGSIIDVDLTVTLTNTYGQDNATIATGTLGVLYYLPLDGTTSHEMVAVGLPGTF